jgi:hypothetical protein
MQSINTWLVKVYRFILAELIFRYKSVMDRSFRHSAIEVEDLEDYIFHLY